VSPEEEEEAEGELIVEPGDPVRAGVGVAVTGGGVWFVEGSTRRGRVDPDCAKDAADEVKRSVTMSAIPYRKKLFFIGVSRIRD